MSEYIYGTDEHEGHWLTGEEIIRCRDCEHYEDYTGCCTRRDYVAPMAATPDGYCAWAKRKEEGE